MPNRHEPAAIGKARSRATRLLRDLRSNDPVRRLAAAERFKVLPSLANWSPHAIVGSAETITRTQALAVIAAEAGYASWQAFVVAQGYAQPTTVRKLRRHLFRYVAAFARGASNMDYATLSDARKYLLVGRSPTGRWTGPRTLACALEFLRTLDTHRSEIADLSGIEPGLQEWIERFGPDADAGTVAHSVAEEVAVACDRVGCIGALGAVLDGSRAIPDQPPISLPPLLVKGDLRVLLVKRLAEAEARDSVQWYTPFKLLEDYGYGLNLVVGPQIVGLADDFGWDTSIEEILAGRAERTTGTMKDRLERLRTAAGDHFAGAFEIQVERGDDEGEWEWSVLLGPERESCYLAMELEDGSWDFELMDGIEAAPRER